MKLILLIAICISVCFAGPFLTYNVGDELHYDTESGIITKPVDDKATYTGAKGHLRSLAAMRCTEKAGSGSTAKFMFVFNCFDTKVSATDRANTAEWYPLESPQVSGNKQFPSINAGSLGLDMFFEMNAQGEVLRVWRYTKDDDRLVRIKLGVINSFHVTLTDSSLRVLESDPLGIHYSDVNGIPSSSSSLTLKKTFRQTDFKQFSDSRVSANMISFQGEGHATVVSGKHQATRVLHNLVVLKAANSGDVSVNFNTNGELTLGLAKSFNAGPSNALGYNHVFALEKKETSLPLVSLIWP
ncbi:hypothetical protein GEMRC1_004112 [Eukaryota sp. GEM-RC1]